MEKILVTEDEVDLARALEMILKHERYDVDIVYNGKEALDKVIDNYYDVIIMDVMMPVMDGITAVKEMRNRGIKIPVLLLTARSMVDDKVEGLDSGANDYLTKPFERKELLARIRVLIKNNRQSKCEIGNVLFDREKGTISSDKISFHLSCKECLLFDYLVKNFGYAISNDDVRDEVWRGEECDGNVIKMYISYLKDKLVALGANLMINYRNGYVLEENRV